MLGVGMIYKKTAIFPCEVSKAETFIMYETVSARADGTELLRFDIMPFDKENDTARLLRGVKRILRRMKDKSMIQCFAFPDGFQESSPEAEFILNKYSEIIDDPFVFPEKGSCVFVKT